MAIGDAATVPDRPAAPAVPIRGRHQTISPAARKRIDQIGPVGLDAGGQYLAFPHGSRQCQPLQLAEHGAQGIPDPHGARPASPCQ